MARASSVGSFGSSGLGFPCATSQNGHRRVQISPMIMKVAVPLLKHSPRFGQDASSHTEAKRCSLSFCLMWLILGEAGILTRIQSGLAGNSTVGMTFTGMRFTFSAPLSFSPSTNTFRLLRSAMILFIQLEWLGCLLTMTDHNAGDIPVPVREHQQAYDSQTAVTPLRP